MLEEQFANLDEQISTIDEELGLVIDRRSAPRAAPSRPHAVPCAVDSRVLPWSYTPGEPFYGPPPPSLFGPHGPRVRLSSSARSGGTLLETGLSAAQAA